MSARYHTNGRCQWNEPRHVCQARSRHIHGPVLPMEQPNWFERLRERRK